MSTIRQKTLKIGGPFCTRNKTVFNKTKTKTFPNTLKVTIPRLKPDREAHPGPGKTKSLRCKWQI
jgi:hypothetical protein